MNYRTLLLLLVVLNFTIACVSTQRSGKDKDCGKAPIESIVINGVEVKLEAIDLFEKVKGGKIEASTTKEFHQIISEAAKEELVYTYLRCLALHRDNYTHVQVAWYDALTKYEKRNPTAEQFSAYLEKHPFPSDFSKNKIEGSLTDQILKDSIERLLASSISLDSFDVSGSWTVTGLVTGILNEHGDISSIPGSGQFEMKVSLTQQVNKSFIGEFIGVKNGFGFCSFAEIVGEYESNEFTGDISFTGNCCKDYKTKVSGKVIGEDSIVGQVIPRGKPPKYCDALYVYFILTRD